MSVTDVRTYTVQVFRDGGFWILEVPELRVVGQSRTLRSAGDTARELVALWLDVPADQVQVVLDYGRIDPEAVELAAGARREQARAEGVERGRGEAFAAGSAASGAHRRAEPAGRGDGAGRDVRPGAAIAEGLMSPLNRKAGGSPACVGFPC
jgi:hypothetical protein